MVRFIFYDIGPCLRPRYFQKMEALAHHHHHHQRSRVEETMKNALFDRRMNVAFERLSRTIDLTEERTRAWLERKVKQFFTNFISS